MPPKADGRQRPLGIAALEDKIVQRALVEVLNAIYETDFLGFSYGFRPGRSQHDALDALAFGISRRPVNWVLDADIRAFFDSISHDWMMRFLEHRIGDRRVLRLIAKWLKAGVMEEGALTESTEGTPQGAVISPLLANIYLHYVYDLWADQWRKREGTGEVIVIRYADDTIVGLLPVLSWGPSAFDTCHNHPGARRMNSAARAIAGHSCPPSLNPRQPEGPLLLVAGEGVILEVH